jgi:predicted P-loop ATPase
MPKPIIEQTVLPLSSRSGKNSPAWLTNKSGTLLPNLANAITMISELPLRWDSFLAKPFLEKKSPWETIGPWTENDDTRCSVWCQRRHLNIDQRKVREAVMLVTLDRKPYFNPVLDYLRGLKWDGVPRLDNWPDLYLPLDSRNAPIPVKLPGQKMVGEIRRIMEIHVNSSINRPGGYDWRRWVREIPFFWFHEYQEEGLIRDTDQLWAEAYHRFTAGEPG